MENFYDYQQTSSGFRLQLSNSLSITEREIHPYHEILYCPDVQTVLHTENRQLKLGGKNLLIIPKGHYHMIDLMRINRFPRLKICVPDEIVSKIPCCGLFSDLRVISTLNLHTELLLRQIGELIPAEPTDLQDFYLSSAVMMLLAELSTLPPTSQGAYKENNALMIQITRYITKNLAGDLSVQTLAKVFSVSPSFLTHRFQKEIGISLHRYITQKRMIYARERIDNGDKPTKFYADCGYKDYSSFYKAYCDFFSHSPSEQVEKV